MAELIAEFLFLLGLTAAVLLLAFVLDWWERKRMGKGGKRRPRLVPRKTWEDNYDAIFGAGKPPRKKRRTKRAAKNPKER